MSIFGKKPDDEPQAGSASRDHASPGRRSPGSQTPAAASTAKSFLGAGCVLDGELSGAGSLECGGKLKGKVEVGGDVVITGSGVATASIVARRISVDGRLEGNATGNEKVEVGPTGHVEGDVRAPAVQFAEGAYFEGNVEMNRSKRADDAGDAPGAGAKPATAS